mgnify:CR=1 FL=1
MLIIQKETEINILFFLESRPPKMKLECLSQYTLHGNVMSMQAVTLIGSQRDSLLLSFRDAKLSVVEYDQDIHDLRTVSLHYFEEEEIRVINIGIFNKYLKHIYLSNLKHDIIMFVHFFLRMDGQIITIFQ